jgi:hypothetical protein
VPRRRCDGYRRCNVKSMLLLLQRHSCATAARLRSVSIFTDAARNGYKNAYSTMSQGPAAIYVWSLSPQPASCVVARAYRSPLVKCGRGAAWSCRPAQWASTARGPGIASPRRSPRNQTHVRLVEAVNEPPAPPRACRQRERRGIEGLPQPLKSDPRYAVSRPAMRTTHHTRREGATNLIAGEDTAPPCSHDPASRLTKP